MLRKIKPLIFLVLAGLSILIVSYLSDILKPVFEPELHLEEISGQAEEVVQLDEYGLPKGIFLVETSVVKSSQTLSHILTGFDFPAYAIDNIVRQVREVFDPRRVRAGNKYHTYYSNDSISALQYIVYEISPLDFIVLDFADSLSVHRGEKEVSVVPQKASGIITSSLWNVLSENNLSPNLAMRLSEILAWEVDFYRIQKGDRFKVVYNENFIGDRSLGVASIEAVYFQHQGRDIYGFHFSQDTIDGYFNAEGGSLRKMFLKAPLEFGRITSRFSHSRLHPIHRDRRPHYGTDYAAPHGTPILAVGDGTVTQASYTAGNGNFVRIRHNSVYETQYLHMSRFASGIKPGRRVKQGEVIGYVGATGHATGPHVCFRFWKNGQQVDHLRERFPTAEPLHKDYQEAFFLVRDQMMQKLESITFNQGPPV